MEGFYGRCRGAGVGVMGKYVQSPRQRPSTEAGIIQVVFGTDWFDNGVPRGWPMAKIHTLLFNMFLANVRAYSFVLLLLLLLAVVFVVFHPVLFFCRRFCRIHAFEHVSRSVGWSFLFFVCCLAVWFSLSTFLLFALWYIYGVLSCGALSCGIVYPAYHTCI